MVLYRYVSQCYRDSVSLMQFSRALKAKPGIEEATAVMATAANLALLRESGLLTEDLAPRPDDLFLLLGGAQITDADLQQAEVELRRPPAAPGGGGSSVVAPGSIGEALAVQAELNFALISVPGEYAAAEALKALAAGLHVMLFSDNVTVADEVFLKQEAGRRGLLLLGPDCGSALVNGVPLGFANQVRRGPVGVVSASGTGLQEVTSLLDRWGSGVSQALGTGGRDLKDAVGGLTALACLGVLEADPSTRVILLVGKPPGPALRLRLEERLTTLKKPVVTCLLGDPGAPTLAEAARRAFVAAEGRPPEESDELTLLPSTSLGGGHYLRGLYSGGTLAAEASLLAGRVLSEVRSNVTAPGVLALDDLWASQGHTVVDLGEDEFTRGRPHPMIDQGLRLARLAREMADPDTAVILVDVVLGHGAHPDPAGELAAWVAAQPVRSPAPVPIVASVVGTEADPQGWSRSLEVLRHAGLRAYGRHDHAVRAALSLIPRETDQERL